ncbi:MAG: MFS transporter [Janthinobacterium lividum]
MKRIAYISCLGIIGILTAEFGVIGILPQIAAYYHIPIEKAGLLLSLFSLAVGVLGPFTSLVAARYNRKAVMAASLTIYLITSIISACSPPFWLLLTVRLLPTLLHSAYYAAALSAVISTTAPDKQHKLMAIALSGVSVATVTRVPLSTWLASVSSWHYSFGLQAAVSALALLAILLLLPSLPVVGRPTYGSQLQILKKPAVWLSLAMCVLLFAAEFSLYSYSAAYLMRVKSATPREVSYYMFLFGLTGLFGTWLAGRALSKSIARTNVAFLFGCTVLVPLGLFYAGNSPLATAMLVAGWGILYAPGFLIATSSISSAAPEALEFANGLTTSFANFGITLGTVAGGWVISHASIAQNPWLSLGLGVAAIGLVGARSLWDARTSYPPAAPVLSPGLLSK